MQPAIAESFRRLEKLLRNDLFRFNCMFVLFYPQAFNGSALVSRKGFRTGLI
jgi:hypothetical protein